MYAHTFFMLQNIQNHAADFLDAEQHLKNRPLPALTPPFCHGIVYVDVFFIQNPRHLIIANSMQRQLNVQPPYLHDLQKQTISISSGIGLVDFN